VIYKVHHITRYTYETPVELGVHLLHLRPRDLPSQHLLSANLDIAPAPSWWREGIDHFGNSVGWLFLDGAHSTFSVASRAVVDVSFPDPPPPSATPSWETVAAIARQGGTAAWQVAEFLFDSPHASANKEAAAYAGASFPPTRPILAALLDLNGRLHRDFTFRPGVTSTATSVREVLRGKEGVCQDFAHVMISALRSLGLPARYVSGYIRTRSSAGEQRRQGAEQSHAWVGCWLGSEHGWVDLDPTNDLVVREEHIVLAWGRDYSDVTPLRGVILGGAEHELSVSVCVEPTIQDSRPDR
jgi:transglutaminase-like putative cysteine protease